MFSVIIPIYNKEKYIVNTLCSVLKQDWQDFEVILIDDGSTDSSIEKVTPFLNDPRLKLVRQENKGVSAARNNGLQHATQDFIAFMDADDLWHPQYLRIMRNTWLRHPDAGIIGSAYTRLHLGERPLIAEIDPEKFLTVPIRNYFAVDKKYHFWTSSTTVRRSVFNGTLKFNEDLTHGEDIDVWLHIMLEYKGVYIEEVLAYYSYAPVIAGKYDFLPPFRKHLVSTILDIYSPWLKGERPAPSGFSRYIYFFTLSMLAAYKFTRNEKKEVLAVYKKVPLFFKFRRLRDIILLIPFPLGKFIFKLYN